MTEVTCILSAIERGDPQAAEKPLPLVYDDLRKLAAHKLAQENPGQTLQATALVHEAYLRLVDVNQAQHWDSRGHFFAAAAEAMRRILVESARRKRRVKHGGQFGRCELSIDQGASLDPPAEIAALDEALDRLEKASPQAARAVTCFRKAIELDPSHRDAHIDLASTLLGFGNAEAAGLLGISPRKANQVWAYARAWLLDELSS